MPSGNRPKGGLGRGIGALIPGAAGTSPLPSSVSGTRDTSVEQGVIEVPIQQVQPNPQQPRQVFEPHALHDLSISIREHGVIQPLIVTRVGENEYQLIAGERRLQASKLAKLERVPVIIKDATPQQILEMALVENIQRADLNPLEEAAAYRHLVQDFKLTQEQVATRVGKSRVAVTNTLRLLNLPDQVRQALLDDLISEGHARAMLMLPLDSPELYHQVLQQVISGPLTVRQTEELVQRILKRNPKQAKQNLEVRRSPMPSIETVEAERTIENALGMPVKIVRSNGGGKLIVEFHDEENLQRLYELLTAQVSEA